MFVVRKNFILDDVKLSNHAVNKKIGRHRGASPSAHFVHRTKFFRSDLPLLFNQKSFTMRKNEQIPAQVQNAINDLVQSGEVTQIKETFTSFFYEWVQSDTLEQEDKLSRSNKVFHYQRLLKLLTQVEQLSNNNSTGGIHE